MKSEPSPNIAHHPFPWYGALRSISMDLHHGQLEKAKPVPPAISPLWLSKYAPNSLGPRMEPTCTPARGPAESFPPPKTKPEVFPVRRLWVTAPPTATPSGPTEASYSGPTSSPGTVDSTSCPAKISTPPRSPSRPAKAKVPKQRRGGDGMHPMPHLPQVAKAA